MTRTRLHDPGPPRRPGGPGRAVVEVVPCRGEGCARAGTAAQERLTAAAASADVPVRVRAAGCLLACPLGPVVVLRRYVTHGGACPRPRTTWLALLDDDAALAALAGWLADGARGTLPSVVRRHEMPVPQGRPVG